MIIPIAVGIFTVLWFFGVFKDRHINTMFWITYVAVLLEIGLTGT